MTLGQQWTLAILCLIQHAEVVEAGGDIDQPAYMLTPFLELKYPEWAGPAAGLPGIKVYLSQTSLGQLSREN